MLKKMFPIFFLLIGGLLDATVTIPSLRLARCTELMKRGELPMHKTLVIVTGSVRGSRLAHESLEEHLLRPYHADLFLCTGAGQDRSSYLYQLATYVEEYQQVEDWRPVMDQMSRALFGHTKWRGYPASQLDECLIGKYDAAGRWTGMGSGLLILYIRYHALEWLERSGLLDQYDDFVITRSDYYYVADHPYIPTLLMGYHVAIPFTHADYGGICDRHAVVDRVGLRAYLSTLRLFLEFHPEYLPFPNHEVLLYHNLRNVYHLNPRRYASPSYMVRADADGAVTWSAGSRRDAHGLWIKEEREYQEACSYLKVVEQIKTPHARGI